MDALSVSKRHVICSEILSVTSAMRKNSRWANTQLYATRDNALGTSLGLRRAGNATGTGHGVARQEVQLMNGFIELKREVLNIESTSTQF